MPKFWKPIWRHFRRWLREPGIIWRMEGQNLAITIEIQSWLPFLAFFIALAWYIAQPVPVAVMTMAALGGLLLAAFFWARTMARSVRGQRKLRFAAMQVGDELEEQVTLRNRSPLPVLWAEFMDRSNIPDYTVSSARAADPDSQVKWRAHTICTRRGVFGLGPWELRLGEPLGIFIVRQVYLQHQEILVYPPLAVLPSHLLPHRGALGDSRPLNQPLRAETIASTTVRPYVQGDPLRHIHWRTSARKADLFVKVFAPEAASSIWLVPDFDQASHFGEGPDSSEETMVTVIASLAAELLQQNLSVGMFASTETESVVLPRQGQSHLWSILQTLAPLRVAARKPLEEVLDRARSLVGGNDLLIVVTPSLQPQWIAPLRRISRSRGSSGRAEVVLLDPVSFGGAESGEIFLPILLEQGITANLLRREEIQLISGYYGEVSRWEFSVLGTGRVITRNAPRLAEKLGERALSYDGAPSSDRQNSGRKTQGN
jgi:uncharacterized protein (DUF58 family)